MKWIKGIVLTTLFTLLMVFPAFADTTFSSVWVQDANGWHAKNTGGSYIGNAWFCDDAVTANGKNVWYLLDPNGNMIVNGLVQDGTGNYYSIETNHNGYYGMMRYQSGMYNCNGQQVYLELENQHNNAFGAVKNADGLAKLMSIYGVTSVANINNSNIVYSSSITTGTLPQTTDGSFGVTGLRVFAGGSGGSSGSGGGSGSRNSSGGSGSNSSQEQAVINQFVAEYIKPGMTPFEKEMQIIQWMVQNIDYDATYLNYDYVSSSRCYESVGALVDKNAVCAGYAKAFVKLCKACGLNAIRVTGWGNSGSHEWNQICLDGKWYNVDVTWEDPYNGSKPNCTPKNKYGFGMLRNDYINCTDSDFSDHSSQSHTNPCNAEDYGKRVIDNYMKTGEFRTNAELIAEENEKEAQRLAEFEEEKEEVRRTEVCIAYTDTDQWIDDVRAFVSEVIESKKEGNPLRIYADPFRVFSEEESTYICNSLRKEIEAQYKDILYQGHAAVYSSKKWFADGTKGSYVYLYISYTSEYLNQKQEVEPIEEFTDDEE